MTSRIHGSISKATLALLLAYMPSFGGIFPQATTERSIDAGKPCATCTVDTVRIATLRSPPSAGPLPYLPRVVRNSLGHFIVTGESYQKLLYFDQQGRFQREVGRGGDAPGEFRGLLDLGVGAGDSLLVFENRRRAHLLDEKLGFVRVVPTPTAFQRPTITSDGKVVVIGRFPIGSPLIGFPGYLLSGAALEPRPVGQRENADSNGKCGGCKRHALGYARAPSSILISPVNRYVISQLDISSGRVTRSISVQRSAWFKNWDNALPTDDGLNPMPSQVLRTYEGEGGRLWVLGVYTPSGWKPQAPPRAQGVSFARGVSVVERGAGRVAASVDFEMAMRFESVIDVLDLERNELLGSMRFRGTVGLLGDGIIYRVVENADLEVELDVFQLRVVRR